MSLPVGGTFGIPGGGAEPPSKKRRQSPLGTVASEVFAQQAGEPGSSKSHQFIHKSRDKGKVEHVALSSISGPPLAPADVKEILKSTMRLPIANVYPEEGGYRIQYSEQLNFASLGLDKFGIMRHRQYRDQSFIRYDDVQPLHTHYMQTVQVPPPGPSPTEQQRLQIQAQLQSFGLSDAVLRREKGGWRIDFPTQRDFVALSACSIFEQQKGVGFLKDEDVDAFLSLSLPQATSLVGQVQKQLSDITARLKALDIQGTPKREARGWRIEFAGWAPDFSALSACKIFQHTEHQDMGFLRDDDITAFLSTPIQDLTPQVKQEVRFNAAITTKLQSLGLPGKPIREPNGWRIDFRPGKLDISSLAAIKIVPHTREGFGFIKASDVEEFLSEEKVGMPPPAVASLPKATPMPQTVGASAKEPVPAAKAKEKPKTPQDIKEKSKFVKEQLTQSLRNLGMPPSKISLESDGYRIVCEDSLDKITGGILLDLIQHNVIQVRKDPPSLFVRFRDLNILQLATNTAYRLISDMLRRNSISATGITFDPEHQYIECTGCTGEPAAPLDKILYHPSGAPTVLRMKFEDIGSLLKPTGWLQGKRFPEQIGFMADLRKLQENAMDIQASQATAAKELALKEKKDAEERVTTAEAAMKEATDETFPELKAKLQEERDALAEWTKKVQKAEEQEVAAKKDQAKAGKKFGSSIGH
jgi:hypothetical protein